MNTDIRSRRLISLLLLGVLLSLGLTTCAGLMVTRQAHEEMLRREGELVSSLLEQGVPESTIWQALGGTAVTEPARALLAAAGRTGHVPFFFFPSARRLSIRALPLLLAAALVPVFLILFATLRYLQVRHRQYRETAGLLERFLEGDFSRHLPQMEEGEFGELCAAADRLAAALQARGESEHRAREFLKRTISDISHQLKTPLSALELYQQILAGEPDCPETVQLFSSRMGVSLERLEGLISSLLQITRLDAGAIAFHRKNCRMEDLAQYAVRDLQLRAAREEKQLLLTGDSGAVSFCDPQWTGEAIANLVKNALDHLPSGGRAVLSWESGPWGSRFRVTDNGPGIPPESLLHIFRRFYRGPDAPDGKGTGLGLPLARAIAEGQGGTLTVRSEPGNGAAFTLSFLTEL